MAKQKTAKQNKEIVEAKSRRNVFQEYSEAFVVAVILAIIIRAFLIQAFKIPSGSMIPTLLIGDHILVNKFIYGFRIPFIHGRWPAIKSPERGDVIVFVYPEDRTKDFIKRVVAVEGDELQIINKDLYINGEKQIEPYKQHIDKTVYPASPPLPSDLHRRDNLGPITVPHGKLFVMGDNRDGSHDSRFWNFVPVEDVKGDAFLIYYSAFRFPNIRWNRMFSMIR